MVYCEIDHILLIMKIVKKDNIQFANHHNCNNRKEGSLFQCLCGVQGLMVSVSAFGSAFGSLIAGCK